MKRCTSAQFGLLLIGVGAILGSIASSGGSLFMKIVTVWVIACGVFLWGSDFLRRRGKKQQR